MPGSEYMISDEKYPALALERVSFGYGSMPVLRSLSLQLPRGGMVGLLGPNGAGKSTLIRLASGALRPCEGAVRIYGRDIRDMAREEIARMLAVVPQDFSVQFRYTVRQLVDLGRTPHRGIWGVRRPGDRDAVDAALMATGTLRLADRPYHDLSGGEKQRVMLALALAQETDILLLDEPTAHLDVRHQIELLSLLQRLNVERHLTVVAAIHDLNLAARFFPRLILLHQEIIRDGSPAYVLDDQLLSRVYQAPVQVGILRGGEYLSVLPVGSQVARTESGHETGILADARVHVVAGGGSGELAMRALADAHIPFTAGPLNAGDSDQELATRLAVQCITEPPYAPVSPQGLAAAKERMARTVVVLCPMPLGHGNIELVRLALDAVRTGRNVLLLEPLAAAKRNADMAGAVLAAVRERDYSEDGEALYAKLIEAGAEVVSSPSEVVASISRTSG